LYLVTGLCAAALLGACTTVYERPVATAPAPAVAYVAPGTTTYVTPTYVAPTPAVVVR
jgi:hypothetical protein